MKVVILAAGQGTRLRPLTDHCPKCMVEVNGKSIIERQLDTMRSCGIKESDITVVAGYCSDVLEEHLKDTGIRVVVNQDFERTNMVCSLMCARETMETEEDILVSYGDIIYGEAVLRKILDASNGISVTVDDGWYGYWSERCENPLDDAETLMYDKEDYLTEIGQKTDDLGKVQSQYIGLMRFTGDGLKDMLDICDKAKEHTACGEKLWRTERGYDKMYMTDLLQGMIDEGCKLKAVHIERGWYEIDDCEDLKVVEREL